MDQTVGTKNQLQHAMEQQELDQLYKLIEPITIGFFTQHTISYNREKKRKGDSLNPQQRTKMAAALQVHKKRKFTL